MNRFNIIFTNRGRLLPLVLLASTLLVGCIKEDPIEIETKKSDVVNIFIPDNATIEVKSGTSDAEKKIYFGYFFVFNSGGGYILHERFDESNKLEGTNTSTLKLSISAASKIPSGGKVIVIANVEPMSNLEGGQRPTFDNAYTYFPLQANMSLIDVATPGLGDFKMPMYGEVTSWTANNPTITLKRSMAKITVRLSGSFVDTGFNNFTNIGNVKYKIYNYARKGCVEPGRYYTSGQTGSVSSIASGNEINNSVSSSNSSTTNSTGVSYIYEYPYSNYRTNSTSATDNRTPNPQRIAVIVKANNRYYRLDFCDMAANYFNVSANTHYKFTINKVNGNGFDTPTKALQNIPSNLDYQFEVNAGKEITVANDLLSMSITPLYHSYVVSSNGFGIYFDVMLETAKFPDGTRVPVPGGTVFSVTPATDNILGFVSYVDSPNPNTNNDIVIGTQHRIYWTFRFVDSNPASHPNAGPHLTNGWEKDVNFQFIFGSGEYKLEKNIPIRLSFVGQKWTGDIMTMNYYIKLRDQFGGAYQSTQWVGTGGIETFSTDYGHKVDNHSIKFEANVYNTNGNIGYNTTPTFKEWRRIVGKLFTQTANGRSRTWIDVSHRSGVYLGRRGDAISSTNFASQFGESKSTQGQMKHALTTRRNHKVWIRASHSSTSATTDHSASKTVTSHENHLTDQKWYECHKLSLLNKQWYVPSFESVKILVAYTGHMWSKNQLYHGSSSSPTDNWNYDFINTNDGFNATTYTNERWNHAYVGCIRPLGGEKPIHLWRHPKYSPAW